MVWFGKPALFGGIYAPVAVAGLLLPYLWAGGRLPSLQATVLGSGLLQGVLAAVLTAVDARSGFICAAWALSATAAAFLTPAQVISMLLFTSQLVNILRILALCSGLQHESTSPLRLSVWLRLSDSIKRGPPSVCRAH